MSGPEVRGGVEGVSVESVKHPYVVHCGVVGDLGETVVSYRWDWELRREEERRKRGVSVRRREGRGDGGERRMRTY